MSSPRIRRLPPELINKIAAGEVVERPASVVKELVENSIDAQASSVEVALEDGGKKLIRVVDDGIGMSPADLMLAFESHATSKLLEPDDLFRIDTLGFRGEALPSIASVSRCRAVSRERGTEEGATVECVAGRLGPVRACGAPEGTIIEVRDLFFNTPARMKFLRSTATELRHAVEAVTRLALPHPSLALTLTHNKRSVLRMPRCESERERLAAVFGDKLSEDFLPVHSESSAMSLTGFISPPGEGNPSSLQYVFVNGRFVRDRAIHRAIAEAYRSRLLRGRFPAALLNIQMDPARVDVNVHPTKVEVRFRHAGAVFAQILTALEKTLRSAEPVSVGTMPAEQAGRHERVRKAITEYFETTSKKPDAAGAVKRPQGVTTTSPGGPALFEKTRRGPELPPPRTATTESVQIPALRDRSRSFVQLHNAYIVEEVEDGFLLIDQHALHERILFEELKQRVQRASVPRQRLLVPEVVDLPPQDFLRAMEMKEALLKMGLEIEAFGEKTIAVQAVPHLASNVNPGELLLEVLREESPTRGERRTDREEELMRLIACKAAIKAGDRLTREKIEALLDQRDRIGPEPICPHGRPTTIRFALRDIEKQFRRR